MPLWSGPPFRARSVPSAKASRTSPSWPQSAPAARDRVEERVERRGELLLDFDVPERSRGDTVP